MNSCLLLTGALFIQEIVSVNAALLNAYKSGCDVAIIHLIYVGTALADIFIGYAVGRWSKGAVADRRFQRISNRFAQRIEAFFGETGRNLSLMFMGFVFYVYIGAFVAAWLDVPLIDAVVYLFLGDAVWYGLEWLTVLGVNTFSDPMLSFGMMLAISLAFVLLIGRLSKRAIR